MFNIFQVPTVVTNAGKIEAPHAMDIELYTFYSLYIC